MLFYLHQREFQFDASRWQDLISLDTLAVDEEPPKTKSMNLDEIRTLEGECELPIFPCHSQTVERAVQVISKTCQFVSIRHKGLKVQSDNRHSAILWENLYI